MWYDGALGYSQSTLVAHARCSIVTRLISKSVTATKLACVCPAWQSPVWQWFSVTEMDRPGVLVMKTMCCLPDLTPCNFFLWGYVKVKGTDLCPSSSCRPRWTGAENHCLIRDLNPRHAAVCLTGAGLLTWHDAHIEYFVKSFMEFTYLWICHSGLED